DDADRLLRPIRCEGLRSQSRDQQGRCEQGNDPTDFHFCFPRRRTSLMTALLSRSDSPARTHASSTSACTSSRDSFCPALAAWSSIRRTSLSVCLTRPSGEKSPRTIFGPL